MSNADKTSERIAFKTADGWQLILTVSPKGELHIEALDNLDEGLLFDLDYAQMRELRDWLNNA